MVNRANRAAARATIPIKIVSRADSSTSPNQAAANKVVSSRDSKAAHQTKVVASKVAVRSRLAAKVAKLDRNKADKAIRPAN